MGSGSSASKGEAKVDFRHALQGLIAAAPALLSALAADDE